VTQRSPKHMRARFPGYRQRLYIPGIAGQIRGSIIKRYLALTLFGSSASRGYPHSIAPVFLIDGTLRGTDDALLYAKGIDISENAHHAASDLQVKLVTEHASLRSACPVHMSLGVLCACCCARQCTERRRSGG
jgi:hypothetical protein